MQKQFWHSIRWNTFDTLYYNVILFGHYTALFHVADTATYGIIGTLFSLLYLAIKGTNCGLDHALAPFFSHAKRSKRVFWRIVGRQIIAHLVFLCLLAVLFLLIHERLLTATHLNIPFSRVRHIWYGILFVTLFLSESAKKTLRIIGQLCFRNRRVAITEAIGISLYVVLFWTLFWLGRPINAALAFGPLLASSLVCCALLAHGIFNWYQKLPTTNVDESPAGSLVRRITINRLFTHVNQCANLLFSSNALIPFFAYQFGLEHAGVVTALSYGTYCVTALMTHVFGATARACFSIGHPDGHRILTYLTRAIIFTIFATTAVAALGYGALRMWHPEVVLASLPLSLCIVGILYYVLHYVLIPYEHWYIINEKPQYVVALNCLNIATVYAALSGWLPGTTITACCLVVGMRIVTFLCAILLFFYHWYPSHNHAAEKAL